MYNKCTKTTVKFDQFEKSISNGYYCDLRQVKKTFSVALEKLWLCDSYDYLCYRVAPTLFF